MKKTGYRSVYAMGGNVSTTGLRMRRKMLTGGNPDDNTPGDDPDLTQGKGTGLNSYNWATDLSSVTQPQPGASAPAGSSFLQGASRISDAITPYMSNIANAFRRPPQVPTPNLVSPVTLSRIRLDATRQQASNASRAQDINADRSLDEQSAAAVRSSNLAKNLNQQGQISEQEAFLNARQKAEAAGMNLNVDAMNTSALNKAQDENVQRTIAIQRNASQNISNASDKYIAEGNERAKANLDLQKLQTLSQIWKESGVYDRMMKRMKGEGVKDPTGVGGQMSWLGDALDNVTQKAMGGALTSPLVGKHPVKPTLLSQPMMGAGKNGFKKVFASGGPGPLNTPGMTQMATPLKVEGDANMQADKFDLVQQMIGSGKAPLQTDQGRILAKDQDPFNQKLINTGYIFNQRPEVQAMNPQQRVQAYMTAPSGDPEVQAYLNKMNIWTRGSNLGQSQDAGVQALSQPVATRAFGGYKNSIAKGYLNPFGNTRSIGLGPGIQKDKFNPFHVSHTQHNMLAMGGVPKSDGSSDVNKDFTNYGDATPDVYMTGGPFQEEWAHGGKLIDHSMWKQPYKENALTNNDPNLYPDGGNISSTAVARKPFPKAFVRTSNGQPVQPSYEFMQPGSSAVDSTQYRSGFANSLNRMSTGKLAPMTDPAFYWTDFNSGIGNARTPGLDTPGQTNAFNSGAREAYAEMPGGSFKVKAMGGEFSGEATARDMSLWNRKVWSDAYAGGGWIGKAVNPAHKGFCTPMTKSTCTPRRKAFAETMKKHHGFH